MHIFHTPLRYPGGKQKIAGFIAEVIVASKLENCHYVEPYAGGAGVALTLLFSDVASHIHLNDLCRPLYQFWCAALRKTDELCRKIEGAELTVDEWRRQREILKNCQAHDLVDVGFSFFYLNRCNRSGIVNGGLIGGLSQDHHTWNMDARFNKVELIRRVQAIGRSRRRITLTNLQADKFMLGCVSQLPSRSLIYCDPPYFNKADRLYMNYYKPGDHERVAMIVQRQLKHPWIVSYDNCPEISRLYESQAGFSYSLQYNAATAKKGTEVFFFSKRLKLPPNSTVACIDEALSNQGIAASGE